MNTPQPPECTDTSPEQRPRRPGSHFLAALAVAGGVLLTNVGVRAIMADKPQPEAPTTSANAPETQPSDIILIDGQAIDISNIPQATRDAMARREIPDFPELYTMTKQGQETLDRKPTPGIFRIKPGLLRITKPGESDQLILNPFMASTAIAMPDETPRIALGAAHMGSFGNQHRGNVLFVPYRPGDMGEMHMSFEQPDLPFVTEAPTAASVISASRLAFSPTNVTANMLPPRVDIPFAAQDGRPLTTHGGHAIPLGMALTQSELTEMLT